MFCGRKESEVPFLLQGLDGFICSDCVELAHDYIADTVQKSVAKALRSVLTIRISQPTSRLSWTSM